MFVTDRAVVDRFIQRRTKSERLGKALGRLLIQLYSPLAFACCRLAKHGNTNSASDWVSVRCCLSMLDRPKGIDGD